MVRELEMLAIPERVSSLAVALRADNRTPRRDFGQGERQRHDSMGERNHARGSWTCGGFGAKQWQPGMRIAGTTPALARGSTLMRRF